MFDGFKNKIKAIKREIIYYIGYNRREKNKDRAIKNIIGRVGKLAGYEEEYKGDY